MTKTHLGTIFQIRQVYNNSYINNAEAMNALYNHGVRQTHQLTRDLATFEKNLLTSPMSLQGTIITSLTAFKKTIKEYNDLIQLSGSTNEKSLSRLEKFNSELNQFQTKFDNLRQQRESILRENNELELMGRRNVGRSENPYDQGPQGYGYDQSQQQTLSQREGLYKEHQSLSRGSQQLDQILEMGQSALEDLVEQNETLKKLGAKFSESLITLGVSQGTIRTIEKRAKQDKWLFWGGVIILFVGFIFLIRYFH